MRRETITLLGLYLARKPVSQAKLARMTGISKDRINKLKVDVRARPTLEEIYLIALALDVNMMEITNYLCKGLTLRPDDEWDVNPRK